MTEKSTLGGSDSGILKIFPLFNLPLERFSKWRIFCLICLLIHSKNENENLLICNPYIADLTVFKVSVIGKIYLTVLFYTK